MKGRPIDQVVYEHMFPKPKSTDPQNFQGLLQRQLVPEVRLETQAFYGHINSQEAKYPGLNYAFGPHRMRLSRFPWHRRLFRAFDNLKLTDSEIQGLTKWEGTKWAKERYEREQGVAIRDTTSDGIEDWVEPELRVPVVQAQRADVEDVEDIDEDEECEVEDGHVHGEEEREGDEQMEDDEDSDEEIRSVGIELNARLQAVVSQREAGDSAAIMDEEWENWLKDAIESGVPFFGSNLSPTANIPGTRPAEGNTPFQITPDFIENMVRQNIEARNRRRLQAQAQAQAQATGSSAPSSLHPSFPAGRVALAPRRELPWNITRRSETSVREERTPSSA